MRVAWATGVSPQGRGRTPRQDLFVHTGDGSIEAQPVSGRLDLSTGDGSITADGLQGGIRLHTGDGSIRLLGL